MRWVIGARKSDLARLQALTVGDALQKAAPSLEISYRFKSSLGDKNLSDPLWKSPEKGLFTVDFLEDLRSGASDLIVHSYKDLPTEASADTEIVAAPLRADVRDVLLMKPDRLRETTITLMSSSPRRCFNLTQFLKDHLPHGNKQIHWIDVRGNVPTRVRKLLESDCDGLIVAKAALDRLLSSTQEEFSASRDLLREALSRLQWMVLPLKHNPTAAAQGALAIEVLKSREDILGVVKGLGGSAVGRAVDTERGRLRSFGGGCHLKLGITHLERPYGNLDFVRGITPEGELLSECLYSPNRKAPPPQKESFVWPTTRQERGLTERTPLAVPPVDHFTEKGHNALFVARSEALPGGWAARAGEFSVLWAAGMATWKKLAAQGLWVNGCCEGLGEREDPRVNFLSSKPLSWLKLTHSHAGESMAWGGEVLATYQVTRKIPKESLQGRTHFYWKSGTEFLKARELCPDIAGGYHFCGPGRSFDTVAKALGSSERVFVHLEGFSQNSSEGERS